jgi:hypothetical protein
MTSVSQRLENAAPARVADVIFDVDTLTLAGIYNDELSAHRAKKRWAQTLQDCFLLDTDTDIRIEVKSDRENLRFLLSCEFLSSCARYAFWRLTNNHVPEAAYLLEIAHIPESINQDLSQGADLRAAMEKELQSIEARICEQKGILQRIGEITKSLVKPF